MNLELVCPTDDQHCEVAIVGVSTALMVDKVSDSLQTQSSGLISTTCHQQRVTEIKMNAIAVQSKLGEGATSDVFCATWNGNQVAIKHMRDSADNNKIFAHEIRMAAVIGRHENLIELVGVCLDSPLPVIVYSLQEGWTLKDVLEQQSAASPSSTSSSPSSAFRRFGISLKTNTTKSTQTKEMMRQSVQWMTDLLSALDYLHSRSPAIAHRDVKPGNMMLSADHSRLRLGDYGLCKEMRTWDRAEPDSTQPMSGVVGSYRYMAPEVYLGLKGRDERADIWSAGCVLWACAVRRIPFELVHDRDVARLVALQNLRPQLGLIRNEALQDVIDAALTREQSQRPTAHEIKGALAAVLKGEERGGGWFTFRAMAGWGRASGTQPEGHGGSGTESAVSGRAGRKVKPSFARSVSSMPSAV